MGARPGEDADITSFTIPGLTDGDKSPDSIANEIAEYFSSISREFEPVNLETLPAIVRYDIMNYNRDSVPDITLAMVEKLLQETKSSKRGTKGDIPPTLFKETI